MILRDVVFASFARSVGGVIHGQGVSELGSAIGRGVTKALSAYDDWMYPESANNFPGQFTNDNVVNLSAVRDNLSDDKVDKLVASLAGPDAPAFDSVRAKPLSAAATRFSSGVDVIKAVARTLAFSRPVPTPVRLAALDYLVRQRVAGKMSSRDLQSKLLDVVRNDPNLVVRERAIQLVLDLPTLLETESEKKIDAFLTVLRHTTDQDVLRRVVSLIHRQVASLNKSDQEPAYSILLDDLETVRDMRARALFLLGLKNENSIKAIELAADTEVGLLLIGETKLANQLKAWLEANRPSI